MKHLIFLVLLASLIGCSNTPVERKLCSKQPNNITPMTAALIGMPSSFTSYNSALQCREK